MEKCHGRFTPPEITREDLPLKSSVRFTPPEIRQGRFSPQIVCMIYPPQITSGRWKIYSSNHLYNLPPSKSEIAFI